MHLEHADKLVGVDTRAVWLVVGTKMIEELIECEARQRFAFLVGQPSAIDFARQWQKGRGASLDDGDEPTALRQSQRLRRSIHLSSVGNRTGGSTAAPFHARRNPPQDHHRALPVPKAL